MKARRVHIRLPKPDGHASAECQRAMQLYSRLWGSDTRPFGVRWQRLNGELLYLLQLLPPPQRTIYYRHVTNVVAIRDPQPRIRNH